MYGSRFLCASSTMRSAKPIRSLSVFLSRSDSDGLAPFPLVAAAAAALRGFLAIASFQCPDKIGFGVDDQYVGVGFQFGIALGDHLATLVELRVGRGGLLLGDQ